MALDLTRLFLPRSIAVIGASSDLRTISGQPLRHLVAHGFPGRLFAVNPRHREVAGVCCFPSVMDIPEVPDLVIIAVKARMVADALRDCGRKGVSLAVILSSGFAETGPAGSRLQAEIGRVAAEYGVRVIGPNCQGFMALANGIRAGFGPVFDFELKPGRVSMVTQSGGFGYAVVSLADEAGIGFRNIISTGNELGVTTPDLLRHFVEDPGTAIVGCYLEGVRAPRQLLDVGLAALDRNKPILVWKVGNSDQGRRAAASHTGNIAGGAALYRALFRQAGIVEIEDLADFVDCSRAFLRGKACNGNRLAIVTVSGGAGVLLADAAAAAGLAITGLSAGTRKRVTEVLPEFSALNNPIDVTAAILNDPSLVRAALMEIVDDPSIDCLAIVNSSVEGAMAEGIAREIVDVDKATSKPVFVSWSARAGNVAGAYEVLDEAGVPRFITPVRCAKALGALFAHSQARQRRAQRRPASARPDRSAGDITVDTAIEWSAKRMLAAHGMSITREALASSESEAVQMATEIGLPVALKIQSADLPHKTEFGGVKLNLADLASVRHAYNEILGSVKRTAPRVAIDGVLVQEMVTDGVEVILGILNDPHFGRVVMFGLGGIYAEVMADTVFRLAPLDEPTVRAMIQETKAWPILQGARGRPAGDIDALVEAILTFSDIAENMSDSVTEMEINPLLVLTEGRGVRVVDALVHSDSLPSVDKSVG